METPKHTPGPWDIRRAPMWNDSTKQQNACYCLFNVRVDDEETANSNARLIAAAPDLLEALKALLDYANDYSDAMAKEGKGAEQLGTLADSVSVAGMARAAIALAEKE